MKAINLCRGTQRTCSRDACRTLAFHTRSNQTWFSNFFQKRVVIVKRAPLEKLGQILCINNFLTELIRFLHVQLRCVAIQPSKFELMRESEKRYGPPNIEPPPTSTGFSQNIAKTSRMMYLSVNILIFNLHKPNSMYKAGWSLSRPFLEIIHREVPYQASEFCMYYPKYCHSFGLVNFLNCKKGKNLCFYQIDQEETHRCTDYKKKIFWFWSLFKKNRLFDLFFKIFHSFRLVKFLNCKKSKN